MPVTDAANYQISLQNYLKNSQVLANALKTLTTLKKMRDMARDMKSAVENVNDIISAGKDIIKINRTMDKTLDVYEDIMDIIANEPDLSNREKEFLIFAVDKKVSESVSTVDESIMISTSGDYKMNDAERLSFLKNMSKKLDSNYSFLLYFKKKLTYSLTKSKVQNVNNSILNEENERLTD